MISGISDFRGPLSKCFTSLKFRYAVRLGRYDKMVRDLQVERAREEDVFVTRLEALEFNSVCEKRTLIENCGTLVKFRYSRKIAVVW